MHVDRRPSALRDALFVVELVEMKKKLKTV